MVKSDASGLRSPVEPAATVIPMDEHQPSTAWRRQRDSSLSVALQLLADHKVDAVVSAGNTGAVVSGGTFILHRIEGFRLPRSWRPFPRNEQRGQSVPRRRGRDTAREGPLSRTVGTHGCHLQ